MPFLKNTERQGRKKIEDGSYEKILYLNYAHDRTRICTYCDAT